MVQIFKNYQYTIAHCTKKTGLKRINTRLSLNATPSHQYEIVSDTQEKVGKHMLYNDNCSSLLKSPMHYA